AAGDKKRTSYNDAWFNVPDVRKLHDKKNSGASGDHTGEEEPEPAILLSHAVCQSNRQKTLHQEYHCQKKGDGQGAFQRIEIDQNPADQLDRTGQLLPDEAIPRLDPQGLD